LPDRCERPFRVAAEAVKGGEEDLWIPLLELLQGLPERIAVVSDDFLFGISSWVVRRVVLDF
jgi:hypothetical protein